MCVSLIFNRVGCRYRPYYLDPSLFILYYGYVYFYFIKFTVDTKVKNTLSFINNIIWYFTAALFQFVDETCDASPCPLISVASTSVYGITFYQSQFNRMAISYDSGIPQMLQASYLLQSQVNISIWYGFQVTDCVFNSPSSGYDYRDGLGIQFPNSDRGKYSLLYHLFHCLKQINYIRHIKILYLCILLNLKYV